MKILAVNWLDLDNPQAGGAEVHFFEIFQRLVARGHEVTLLCSGFAGPASATVGGVSVHRVGGRYSFALRARRAIAAALGAGSYDIVVEDINKLPLFTPSLTSLPVYAIVPHLFGTTAFQEAPFPIAAIVWLAERAIPRVYRGAAFHAISDSTRDDLIRRGVAAAQIRVISPGVDAAWYAPAPETARAPEPLFLYVGRLRRYKGIETVLRALAVVRARGDAVHVAIAGTGEDRPRLERVAASLGLGDDAVRFHGYVSPAVKRTLLRRAWAALLPSAKEGWGLTNVEAAACGTPAIASDRPGCRDSVRHGETGLLVPYGDVAAWAEAMIALARDPARVEHYGRAARRFAEMLSWQRAAEQTEAHLIETIKAARCGRKE